MIRDKILQLYMYINNLKVCKCVLEENLSSNHRDEVALNKTKASLYNWLTYKSSLCLSSKECKELMRALIGKEWDPVPCVEGS